MVISMKYKNRISMSDSTDKIYNEYKNRIIGKARYLRSKDIEVQEYSILPKDRFDAIFKRYRLSDKKLSAGRIVDNVVTKQLSRFSSKQARALLKAQDTGSKVILIDIMYGSNFVEEIKNAYHEMRNSGMSSKDAKRKISQSYFGSP